jgi:hypothetical protein
VLHISSPLRPAHGTFVGPPMCAMTFLVFCLIKFVLSVHGTTHNIHHTRTDSKHVTNLRHDPYVGVDPNNGRTRIDYRRGSSLNIAEQSRSENRSPYSDLLGAKGQTQPGTPQIGPASRTQRPGCPSPPKVFHPRPQLHGIRPLGRSVYPPRTVSGILLRHSGGRILRLPGRRGPSATTDRRSHSICGRRACLRSQAWDHECGDQYGARIQWHGPGETSGHAT